MPTFGRRPYIKSMPWNIKFILHRSFILARCIFLQPTFFFAEWITNRGISFYARWDLKAFVLLKEWDPKFELNTLASSSSIVGVFPILLWATSELCLGLRFFVLASHHLDLRPVAPRSKDFWRFLFFLLTTCHYSGNFRPLNLLALPFRSPWLMGYGTYGNMERTTQSLIAEISVNKSGFFTWSHLHSLVINYIDSTLWELFSRLIFMGNCLPLTRMNLLRGNFGKEDSISHRRITSRYYYIPRVH